MIYSDKLHCINIINSIPSFFYFLCICISSFVLNMQNIHVVPDLLKFFMIHMKRFNATNCVVENTNKSYPFKSFHFICIYIFPFIPYMWYTHVNLNLYKNCMIHMKWCNAKNCIVKIRSNSYSFKKNFHFLWRVIQNFLPSGRWGRCRSDRLR